VGSWYVSGEAAGAGWQIEGTTDVTGRGKKEKMARWKAKVRRKLAMEDGRWEVSWFDSSSPCVPPGHGPTVVGTVRRPLRALQARLPASNRTAARIQDTQDRHCAPPA
jgi:hypothetical protein